MSVPASDSTIAQWLRQKRALLALLRRDDYRRDVIGLFVTNLRALFGIRLILAINLLGALGGFLTFRYATDARTAYDVLQIIFGIAAVGAGATLYSAEREAGTFELLWLATGSERVLLRLKIVTMLVALLLIITPAVFLVSRLVGDALPVPQTILFLGLNTLFILCVLTLVSTFLPQAWAGGLLGAALLAAVYLTLYGSTSAFHPFRNPFTAPSAGLSITNRILIVLLSIFLYDAAARRLRRSF